MLQKDVKVGGRYVAMVSGKLTVVKVDSVSKRKGYGPGSKDTTMYSVTNETTGRKTVFKSAAKFRKEAPAAGTKPAKPPKPKLLDNLTGTFRRGTPEADANIAARTALNLGDTALVPDGEGEKGSDPTPPPTPPSAAATSPSPNAGPAMAPEGSSGTGTAAPASVPPANGGTTAVGIAELFRSRVERTDRAEAAEAATVAGYAPTEEQREILRTVRPGLKVVVVGAGAGTGKTSTLKMLEEVLPGRGQYTAFNAALVAESKTKFRRAACNTTHSLAFKAVGCRYAHRLGGQRVRSEVVAKMIGLESLTITVPDPEGKRDEHGTPLLKEKVLSAGFLTSHVSGAIRKFCQSADDAVSGSHFKRIAGIDSVGDDGMPDRTNSRQVVEYLMPYAQTMWEDITNVRGQVPFAHDHYVKIWQLGTGPDTPVIPADYILLDEAQDTAPVFLDIISRQDALVVLVGDDNQRIYEWRGAVNAMASFPGAPRRLLSQSFRFGQAIADVANSILTGLDEPTDLVLKGLDTIPSIVVTAENVGRLGAVEPDAVLCRTNARAVGTVLTEVAAGRRPHLVGGGAEVVSFVKAARDLQQGRGTGHMELCCFDSWTEVQEYVKTDDGEDLKLMVKLIDEFGVEPILEALEGMPPEEAADLIVCTAHKSKGREWPVVKLASDFPTANAMDDAACRLLYVAATRAQHVLDLTECPPFLPGKDEEGKPVKPIVIDWTRPMPEREELTTWLANEAVREALAPRPVAQTTQVPDRPPASLPRSGTPEDRPEFTWASHGSEWLVRGPAGRTGQVVTVTKKSGETSQDFLIEAVAEKYGSTLYRSRRA